jgi:hypothetical protein
VPAIVALGSVFALWLRLRVRAARQQQTAEAKMLDDQRAERRAERQADVELAATLREQMSAELARLREELVDMRVDLDRCEQQRRQGAEEMSGVTIMNERLQAQATELATAVQDLRSEIRVIQNILDRARILPPPKEGPS